MREYPIEIPQPALTDSCRRHDIRSLALFGSVLRADFGRRSDVDILVEFGPQARRIAEAVENITFDEFRADWRVDSAVQHQLLILGEAVKRLSRQFREDHAPKIPWQAIAGHGDILIHQYNAVDFGEVWLIAKDRIPELVQCHEAVAPHQE